MGVVTVACWTPGPWKYYWNPKPQPESPHQAAIADSMEQAAKPRKRTAKKVDD